MDISNDKARQKQMLFDRYEMRCNESSEEDIIPHPRCQDWDRSFKGYPPSPSFEILPEFWVLITKRLLFISI